jgi:hypothetical protein
MTKNRKAEKHEVIKILPDINEVEKINLQRAGFMRRSVILIKF